MVALAALVALVALVALADLECVLVQEDLSLTVA
jgi:hypothetical protein